MKKDLYPTVNTLISEGKISETINLLSPRVAALTSHPEFVSKLNSIKDTYSRLLDFFKKGFPDPGRQQMINSIGKSLTFLAGRIDFETKVNDNEGLYYARIRADRLSPANLVKLLESYLSIHNMLSMGADESETADRLYKKRDELLERVFLKSMILRSETDGEALEFIPKMMESADYPTDAKLQVLSALTLDLMAAFDREIFIMLLEIYDRYDNPAVQAKALTAVFIALHLYSDMIASDGELILRLGNLSDSIMAYRHLREIVLTMIRTRDTGRVNEKFQKEVLDNFKNFKPNVKMPDSDMLRTDINGDDVELNPEWQEFLEKSGIEKKLRKFSELQSEGADLMMITFAQLKNFSFFRSPANWFLPFDKNHSSLVHYRDLASDSLNTFLSFPGLMCDSDKYSLALSLSQMPADQRLMLNSQMEAQQQQMSAELESKLLSKANPEFANEVLMTMRSIYRFINLFAGASTCFHNPFDKPVDVTRIPALEDLLCEEEILQLVSEFYFKHGYYREALNLFNLQERQSGLNMYLAEKIGYCHERQLDYASAYAYYAKAELLGASSKWLWRRMLNVLADSDPQLALQYAEQLYNADPDSLKSRLEYIKALKNTSDEEKLLKLLYKCYFENPDFATTTLMLVRILFNQGDYDKAADTLSGFSLNPDASDDDKREFYSLKALLALVTNNISDATDYFKLIGEAHARIELEKVPDNVFPVDSKKLLLELIRLS